MTRKTKGPAGGLVRAEKHRSWKSCGGGLRSRRLGRVGSSGAVGQRRGVLGRIGRPGSDRQDLVAVDGLLLQEQLDEAVQCVAMVAQELACPQAGFLEEALHLLVDDLLRGLGVLPV